MVVVGRKSLGGADWQRHAGGFRKERLQRECPNIACHWTLPLPLVASAHRLLTVAERRVEGLGPSSRCLVASVVQYSAVCALRSDHTQRTSITLRQYSGTHTQPALGKCFS